MATLGTVVKAQEGASKGAMVEKPFTPKDHAEQAAKHLNRLVKFHADKAAEFLYKDDFYQSRNHIDEAEKYADIRDDLLDWKESDEDPEHSD